MFDMRRVQYEHAFMYRIAFLRAAKMLVNCAKLWFALVETLRTQIGRKDCLNNVKTINARFVFYASILRTIVANPSPTRVLEES